MLHRVHLPWALRKAWRDLAARRVRSLLTILGVAVGVGGLVAIVSTARNITRAQRELFATTSQANLVYWVWDAPAGLIPLLESNAPIETAELRVTYWTRWRPSASGGARSWMDIELVGLESLAQDGAGRSGVRLNQFTLVEGRLPSVGEVLLEVSASRQTGVAIGQEIAYRDRFGNERSLRVSGLTRSPSYLSTGITRLAVGYVPASYLRRAAQIPRSNQLLVRLRDPQDAAEVTRYLQRLFRRQGLQHGSPEIRNPEQFPGKRELDALIMVMFLFSGLGLFLSSFLVVNTLSASVAEQLGEIGVLKALGATSGQILRLYLLESLVYGVIGSLVGVALGAIVSWRLLVWIGSLGNAIIRFRLAPEGLALGLLVGMVLPLVGGLIPAARGARITVKASLEASDLASGGIRTDFGQSWLDRQLGRMRRLPPLAAMAVRNLGRRRGRSLLTLLLIALATAGFIGAASTRDSVNAAIAQIYETYQADAWVWFGSSVSLQLEDALRAVEGVYAAEGWMIANGVVGLREARLWGIPADSALYQQVMREGRWYREGEHDAVVLSAELADSQNLRVGDVVEIVHPASGPGQQFRSFRVVGIAVDRTIFLGGALAGKAFIPRDTLSRMLGSQRMASFFALGLASRERSVADEVVERLDFRFGQLRPMLQPISDEIESAREASRLLTLGLAAMLILVALVGSLGITNTLALSVLERRREVAVMRAVGATDAALVLIFLAEGAALGGLGWLLGLALGYPAGRLFTEQLGRVLFALGFMLSPGVVLASLLFTVGLSIVSSLGPALGAAQLRADAALRYE